MSSRAARMECLGPCGESFGLSGNDRASIDAVIDQLTSGEELLCEIVREHLKSGGKYVRAQLAVAACDVFGVLTGRTVWAAACELMHNASLIHDDIQDYDRARRGLPALWSVHGASQAINAGILLMLLPFAAIEQIACSDSTRWCLLKSLCERAEEAVKGQALELSLANGMIVDWGSWERAVVGKTGALLALPIEGAALLSGTTGEFAGDAARPFCRAGLAFQLLNDLSALHSGDRFGKQNWIWSLGCVLAKYWSGKPSEWSSFWAEVCMRKEKLDGSRRSSFQEISNCFLRVGVVGAIKDCIQDVESSLLREPLIQDIPALGELASRFLNFIKKGLSDG